MKVRVVHRDPEEYDPAKKTRNSTQRVYRNADPALHPFEKAREIQRALVATKMEKIFSKPLVGVLDGHRDAVRCMRRCRKRVNEFFTGSCDGEIRMWDLAHRQCIRSIRAHQGFVRGLTVAKDDTNVLSCGDDSVVKQWDVHSLKPVHDLDLDAAEDSGNLVKLSEANVDPLGVPVLPNRVWNASGPLTCVDHHQTEAAFVTAGETVDVWDMNRSGPNHSFEWGMGTDVVYTARFNPGDSNLIAASGGDNAIALFDLRASSRIGRIIMKTRPNALCWNPMIPLNFVAANDDANLYTFDMRQLTEAFRIHKDFTAPVLDVDFAPTGREFAAGSSDRTVRLFKADGIRSRDVYYAKRMQMVTACQYTADARFILSGSADFCVRLWKSKAWEALGPKTHREKRALAYREALKERHQFVPEIRRILTHHHVPKQVKKTADKQRIMREAAQQKELNRQLHSAPSAEDLVPEKAKAIRDVQN